MCVIDCHDMTLALKVVLNPNITKLQINEASVKQNDREILSKKSSWNRNGTGKSIEFINGYYANATV